MVILKQISEFVFEDISGGDEPIFLRVKNDVGALEYLHQSGYGSLSAESVVVIDA